jgi:hypothetical protein
MRTLLLLVVPAALSAQVNRWVAFDTSHNETTYIDTVGIKVLPQGLSGWFKTVLKKPVAFADTGKLYKSALMRLVVDCTKIRSAIASVVWYDAVGKVVAGQDWPESDWTLLEAPPDSQGELETHALCDFARSRKLIK